MTITNKRSPTIIDYHLHGQTLQRVKSAKYLGIEITSNLKWTTHIKQIASKANKTSAFIHRNLKGCPFDVQTQCYKSMVRPILEYSCTVWDPHLKQDIETLEKCQKRTARKITSNFSPFESATKIVKSLGLETLKSRRTRNKITTFHNIYYSNSSSIHLPDNMKRPCRTTRGHTEKLSIPHAKTDMYRHSFFPSTGRLWNKLPKEVAETGCPTIFKRPLEYHLKTI